MRDPEISPQPSPLVGVPNGIPLPPLDLWWATCTARRLGPRAAAQLIGISKNALAAACLGWTVHPRTAMQIHAARLRDHDAA